MRSGKQKKRKVSGLTRSTRPVGTDTGFGQTQPADRERREKVTVSVSSSLLAAVDEFVSQHQTATRSAVIDQALNMWCQRLQEQEDIAYYGSLSAAAGNERKGWTDAAARTLGRSWGK